jgi:hypothetical protein
MEVAVLTYPPPAKDGAQRPEREPGGHVCLVIEVGHDDLIALAQGLADRQADQPDERSRVHPERNFAGIAGIDQGADADARPRDGLIHRDALRIASAPLHHAFEQVLIDCVEDCLRHLGARRIVEENAAAGALQGRKLGPQAFDRERLPSL